MTGKEFLEFHRKTIERMHNICAAKNHDYSGGEEAHAFNNFEMVEKMGACTVEQGFVTRMTDKIMRITNLCKSEAAVSDEKIEDTLMDLANYSILMMGYLKYKKSIPSIFTDPDYENKKSYMENLSHLSEDQLRSRIKDLEKSIGCLGGKTP